MMERFTFTFIIRESTPLAPLELNSQLKNKSKTSENKTH